jgi:hypothetical protein
MSAKILCSTNRYVCGVRFGVYLIQKAPSIFLCEDARETPGLFFHRLHILYFYDEHVSRLGGLDIEGTGETISMLLVSVYHSIINDKRDVLVNACEIYISHIICRIVVANLTTSPVNAFNLDDFAVLDGAVRGD